jgi:hypothetical protein
VVAAPARPPGGIARPAFGEPPAPVPRTLFPLFYLVDSGGRSWGPPQGRFFKRDRTSAGAGRVCSHPGMCVGT